MTKNDLQTVVQQYHNAGYTWAELAAALDGDGYKTTAGGTWTKDAARNYFRRYVSPDKSDRQIRRDDGAYTVSSLYTIPDDSYAARGWGDRDTSNVAVSERPAKAADLQTLSLKDAGSVFIIPDVHEPFSIDGFAEWCRDTADRWDCDTIVQIGDLVDNYASSLHQKDPDNPSALAEYEKARERLQKWFDLFPDVVMTLGNHDDRPLRTAKVGGLSSVFVKSFREVWGIPDGWKICQDADIDGVLYTHQGGGGRSPSLTRALSELTPVVSGHYHTVAGVAYHSGRNLQLWGLDVGCGVDRSGYGLAYNTSLRGYMLGAGIVVSDGKNRIPHFVPFTG